jgi:hypothetical protein
VTDKHDIIGSESYQPHPRTLAAVASYIDGDERFAGRYVSQLTTTEDDRNLKLPALLVTDRRLLILTEKGFFGSKFNVINLPYENLRPGVYRDTDDYPDGRGSKYYTAGIQTIRGGKYIFGFLDEREWSKFSGILEATLLMYKS